MKSLPRMESILPNVDELTAQLESALSGCSVKIKVLNEMKGLLETIKNLRNAMDMLIAAMQT